MFFNMIVWAQYKFENHLINLTYGFRLSGYAMGIFVFLFCFGGNMFAVVTCTNISSSPGRWYWPVISLSFLDIIHSYLMSKISVPVKMVVPTLFR